MTTHTHSSSPSVTQPTNREDATELTPDGMSERALVLAEIQTLVESLPGEDRAFLYARFGWDNHPPRSGERLRAELGLTARQERDAMLRCLDRFWFAQLLNELPATRALLGDDRSVWVARAWQHTEYLADRETRVSYTHLLLVLGGAGVEKAQELLSKHLRGLRVEERAREHQQRMRQAARDRVRRDLTRLIEHTIWPERPREVRDLDGYRTMRKLIPGDGQSGYFFSHKLHRLVQYDSALERHVLQAFETDGRVVAYQEQPIQLPVQIGGRQLRYTPDAIVQLHDGRTIIIEIKPDCRLGYLDNWLRWHALWQWCCQPENRAGMFIGSPRTSILDHYQRSEDTPLRSELSDAAAAGPIGRKRYLQLKHANDASLRDIAHAVTALQLDWREQPFRITHPSRTDQKAIREFWNTVALAAITLETQPV